MGKRHPEAQVSLLLEALRQYEVMAREDWNITVEGGLLGRGQVEHIRQIVYEELLRVYPNNPEAR